MRPTEAPIGVFDSGIGGLTVVREIMRTLPNEGVAYLGDTARVPYGTRSRETVVRYAREGAEFLLKRGIKLLVVACNTVSSVAMQSVIEGASVPVVGVIIPGARAATEKTKNRKIGVIGTEATISSGAYHNELSALDNALEVHSTVCPLFVPLVEEGWLEGEVPELVAGRYLGSMRKKGIDTLVLGCTHYPLLKPVISKVMGEEVALVDSATETAREVGEELEKGGLLGAGDGALREFYVTDNPEKFKEVGERFLGTGIGDVRKVRLEVHE
jgi:glutamate racemase